MLPKTVMIISFSVTTISRDIKYLTEQSQSYLNSLAKETLPFMYQTSIEGIRDVLKECYTITQSQDSKVNMYHKLAALKLIKECHEAIFRLLDEGPSVLVQLRIVKNVQGGTATPSQFTIHVNGSNPSQSTFPGSSLGTIVALAPGSYNVTEISGPSGYTPTYSSDCSGSIMAGQKKMCTVTNTQTATLKVIKHVNNTYFGPYDVSTFQFRIEGNNPTPTEFAGSESGTNVTLGGGTYLVDEFATAQGYTLNYSRDCTGTINPGETKTCTVTNTAHFGKVKVIKHVVGGTASASQFEIGYSYTCDPEFGCSQTAGIRGNESGTDILMVQGTYQIEELPPQYNPPGYTPTYSGDCSGHLGSGETKTCTVTNTFTSPTPETATIIVTKVVNGGPHPPEDFNICTNTIDPSTRLSTPATPPCAPGSGSGFTYIVKPGEWAINEILPSDSRYTSQLQNCGTALITAGQTRNCTYTNTYTGPRTP